MATYEVRYPSRSYPTNADGIAVGLGVLRDGDYFQFFLPIVSGLELATMAKRPGGTEEWWQAVTQLGAQEVELMVWQGVVPNEDPTHGVLVPIPAQRIDEYLDAGEPLPVLEDELLGGQHIASFRGP